MKPLEPGNRHWSAWPLTHVLLVPGIVASLLLERVHEGDLRRLLAIPVGLELALAMSLVLALLERRMASRGTPTWVGVVLMTGFALGAGVVVGATAGSCVELPQLLWPRWQPYRLFEPGLATVMHAVRLGSMGAIGAAGSTVLLAPFASARRWVHAGVGLILGLVVPWLFISLIGPYVTLLAMLYRYPGLFQ